MSVPFQTYGETDRQIDGPFRNTAVPQSKGRIIEQRAMHVAHEIVNININRRNGMQ